MLADIYTKFFSEKFASTWEHVRRNVNVLMSESDESIGTPGVGWKHRHDNPGKYETEDPSLDISDYVAQPAPCVTASKPMIEVKESWSQTDPTEPFSPVRTGPELVAIGKSEKLPLEAPTKQK